MLSWIKVQIGLISIKIVQSPKIDSSIKKEHRNLWIKLLQESLKKSLKLKSVQRIKKSRIWGNHTIPVSEKNKSHHQSSIRKKLPRQMFLRMTVVTMRNKWKQGYVPNIQLENYQKKKFFQEFSSRSTNSKSYFKSIRRLNLIWKMKRLKNSKRNIWICAISQQKRSNISREKSKNKNNY